MLGGINNDSLYGEAGVDTLDGEAGNDGIFGGVASTESIRGGSGADRFLIFGNDAPADLGSGDTTIVFRNEGSSWTDREIEAADVGLRQLHHRTGATRIFVDPLDTGPMTLYKVRAGSLGSNIDGINELQWSASWEADGTIVSETYTRSIKIADWNENIQAESEVASLTVIHEIGHSFDSTFELAQVSSSSSIWNSFLAQSGWETANPGSGHTRAPLATQEVFERVYVAPNYELVTKNWWRNDNAEFARNYGTTNAKEDWATTWEAIFVDAIVEERNSSHAVQVPGKVALVNRFLDVM